MLPSSPGSIWGPPPPPAARRAAGDGTGGEAQQQEGKEQEQEAAAVLPAEHPLAGMFFSQRTRWPMKRSSELERVQLGHRQRETETDRPAL